MKYMMSCSSLGRDNESIFLTAMEIEKRRCDADTPCWSPIVTNKETKSRNQVLASAFLLRLLPHYTSTAQPSRYQVPVLLYQVIKVALDQNASKAPVTIPNARNCTLLNLYSHAQLSMSAQLRLRRCA